MTRKILGLNGLVATGDSSHFGTNDTDYINQYLTGVNQTDTVDINTDTKFRSSRLKIANTGNTANYILAGGAITSDQTLTLPALTANATISTQGPNVITVAADGTGQFTDLYGAFQSITNNTIVNVAAGTYSTPSTRLPSLIGKSNIKIQGAGQGVTNIVADTTVTGDTPILDIEGSVVGSSFSLTASTAVGDTSVTISAANATTLNANGAVGQYVLIRSNKQPDTEFTSVHAGEMQLVTAINTTTGVVTLRDELNDAYLTTDSASLIQINPSSDIIISDITFSSVSNSSSRTAGFIFCRFVTDLHISDCEVSKGWWAGLHLSSCMNSTVETCYVHDIRDPSGSSGSTHYGLVVHAASRNVVADTCNFSTLRHSFTAGGQTGTNYEGVVRSVTVTNCTSETTDTAHFDTHQACENIVFSSNTTIGGVPATGNNGAYGFQVRSPKTSLIGNTMLRPKGKGIYIFGQGSGTVISGCTVNNAKQYNSAGGDAIYLDPSITGVAIGGACRFQDCEGHVLTGGGTGTNDNVFTGNIVNNCCTVTNDGNIKLQGFNNVIVGNRFKAGPNRPVQMSGTADNWTISDNDFTGMSNTAPALVGTASTVKNNMGYNAVGTITNAFTTTGSGDILNVSQPTNPAALPATGTTWTNRFTSKTITVTGGTVSSISINGSASVGTSGMFKLGVGETINITYSVAPTVTVRAE